MRIHTIREGESLSGIAALHGVDVRSIVAANPRKARLALASGVQVFRALASGEEIAVPTLGTIKVGDPTPLPPHASCPGGGIFHINLCLYPDQFDTSVFAPTCDPHYVWDKASLSCLPDPSSPPPDPGPTTTTTTDTTDTTTTTTDPSASCTARNGIYDPLTGTCTQRPGIVNGTSWAIVGIGVVAVAALVTTAVVLTRD